MNDGRRDFLATLGAGAMAAPFATCASGASPSLVWPQSFVWGVATAAHQIEGNNVNSDYWVLEHIKATNFKDASGDACDSWNRWREDIALVRAMNLTAYRFSVEWARIEPEEGFFSLAALDHYRRMCAACREVGIMPIVTFHHFSSPRWLAARGGWENPQTAERFARYCARAARALGDLIGAACTMNEPNAQVTSYIMRGNQPFAGEQQVVEQAARAVGSDRFHAYFMGDSFKVRDVCINAHRLAVTAIKEHAPGVKVGLTLALQDLIPTEAGEPLHRRIFENARLPFYQAASKDDFLGVQPYLRMRIGASGYLPAPEGVMTNRYGADASPNALSAVVREAYKHAKVPILVSENGIDTVDDTQRVQHLRASISELESVVTGGIPVLGYLHWSLLDNFEWRSGYAPRFGLYSVDRTTFARTAKSSATAYRDLVLAQRGRSVLAQRL